MPRQLIGRGEQESFQSFRVRRQIFDARGVLCGSQKIVGREKFRSFQFARDVEYRLAFAHRERQNIDFAMCQLPKNIFTGCGVIEKIFSGFKRTSRMTPRVKFERDCASNHAIFLQEAGGCAAGGSPRNGHKHAFAAKSLIRFLNSIPKVSSGAGRDQQENQKDDERELHLRALPSLSLGKVFA